MQFSSILSRISLLYNQVLLLTVSLVNDTFTLKLPHFLFLFHSILILYNQHTSSHISILIFSYFCCLNCLFGGVRFSPYSPCSSFILRFSARLFIVKKKCLSLVWTSQSVVWLGLFLPWIGILWRVLYGV